MSTGHKPIPTDEEQTSFLKLCNEPFARLWNKMTYKAAMRAYKGTWREGKHTVKSAWDRLHEELDELRIELEAGADPDTVDLEAADVANFLVVIMDIYRLNPDKVIL